MDWVFLIGLTVTGALLLVAMMGLLRFERRPRRIPTWLPAAGLAVTGLLFALAILSASWVNVALFGLNMLVFSMLLGVSRRPDSP